MRYYPVNLDILNRRCLVVGGGAVSTRKVQTLLDCGGEVMVVSPEVSDKLQDLARRGQIDLRPRGYRSSDLNGVFLVIGATDNEVLNREISADANNRNILCNIADRPEICNFILPAVIKQGDLIIGVSTSGKSPALAKKLRLEMERLFGQEYAVLLTLMGAVRKKLLAQKHEPEAHKHLFEKLLNSNLIDMLRENDIDAVDALLHETLGREFSYTELMGIS